MQQGNYCPYAILYDYLTDCLTTSMRQVDVKVTNTLTQLHVINLPKSISECTMQKQQKMKFVI